MIGAVHQRHAGAGMLEMFAEKQAAKARAQHDDVECFIARHALNFNESTGNAKRGVY